MQATIRRSIRYFSISSRQPLKEHVFGAPNDFQLTLEPAADPGTFPRLALLSSIDLIRERALYALLPNDTVAKVFDSAFLRAGQMRYASGIVSVPVERLPEVDPLPDGVRATLAFSIGRTGSTLLTRLLHALGQPSASEPDVLTQICALTPQEELLFSEGIQRQLVASCVASLSRFLGPTPFIKLSSQCNARPEALMSAIPASTPLLMLRNRTDWAISRHRAFREPPREVADVLKEGVAAFEKLSRAGSPPRVVWYEDLVTNPVAVLEATWPSLDLGSTEVQGKLKAVMATDSQEGTSVAQSVVRLRPIEDGFLRDFDREWRDIAAKEPWSSSARELVEQLEKRVA